MNARDAYRRWFLRRLSDAGAWPPIDSARLYDKTGDLAKAVGVFRRRIVADRLCEGAPPWVQEFLIFHEGAHVLRRHVLWLTLVRLLTLGVAEPFVRAQFERAADRLALAAMRPRAFVNAIHHVYRPPKKGLSRWLYVVVYGATWKDRCERAGVVLGGELGREREEAAA